MPLLASFFALALQVRWRCGGLSVTVNLEFYLQSIFLAVPVLDSVRYRGSAGLTGMLVCIPQHCTPFRFVKFCN